MSQYLQQPASDKDFQPEISEYMKTSAETVDSPYNGADDSIRLYQGMSRRQVYTITFFYLLIITTAEIITAYYDPELGVIIHGLLMFILFGHAAFIYPTDRDMANLLMSIGIAPLIRIISLTTPLSSFSYIYWFLVLSIPLFSGILVLRAIQNLNEEAMGLVLNMRKLHWEILIILAGFPLGVIEYFILKPESIINELTLQSLIAPALIMIICTGLIEELIFRGLVQHNAIRVLGTRIGIIITSIVFGFLHTGNLNMVSVFFAAGVGFIYSLVRLRTGSILGISLSHGVLNCMLFLVLPLDPF